MGGGANCGGISSPGGCIVSTAFTGRGGAACDADSIGAAVGVDAIGGARGAGGAGVARGASGAVGVGERGLGVIAGSFPASLEYFIWTFCLDS